MGEVSFINHVDELKAYRDRVGLSLTELARRLSCSKSKISMVLNGKYENAQNEAAEMLKRLSVTEAGFSTVEQQTIEAILSFCREDMELGLVVGISGMGKTHVCKKFESEHADVFRFQPTEFSTTRSLLRSMGDALGVKVYGTIEERLKKVIGAIRQKGYRLLIIDEADVLDDNKKGSSVIRKFAVFRQMFEAGIGVVLVGLPGLDDAINRLPGYIQNRISYFRKYDRISRESMRRYLEQMVPEADEESTSEAIENAEANGGFRYLRMFAEKGKKIGYKSVLGIIWAGAR